MISAGWLPAAGPIFTYHLLGDGGSCLLTAPTANFSREIELMLPGQAGHRAVPSTNSHPADAAEAELSELQLALAASGRSESSVERIVSAHGTQRALIRSAVEAGLSFQTPVWPASTPPLTVPVVSTGAVRVVDGLPGEFADYFRGAISWHAGATNAAILAWERLLKRPAGERHFRSTWAAFMLGKAYSEIDPRRSIACFQQVRSLSRSGFADSIGLAAASLGWEARVELSRERFDRAIDLYLEQAAAGDNTAMISLRWTADVALKEGTRSLAVLARHPRAQRVITAYLISGRWNGPFADVDNAVWETLAQLLDKQSWFTPAAGWHTLESPPLLWLEAAETAKILDADSAEKLALAAYQFENFDAARRWLKLAGDRPLAQWLQAKLALRDGQLEVAFRLLSTIVQKFPPRLEEDPALAPGPKAEALFDRLDNRGMDVRKVVLAEWAALQLVRRAYTESLDAFLRSGHWPDAAYVADRVLTLDELKTYIDRAWPEASSSEYTPRDWLACRLIRAKKFQEARTYLKGQYRPSLDAIVAGMSMGRDPQIAPPERAAALWSAAEAVMASDLTLFTAPAETEWGVSAEFWLTNTPPRRLQPVEQTVLPVTDDEEQRVRESDVYPRRDWYYRFVAAELAWEAAGLMPDNSTETAHALWRAGTWIKYADPKAADRFYKALVRRCGRTPLGREADRRRWLPNELVAAQLRSQPR